MATIKNSSFKIKAGIVTGHEGIQPEKGAILFNEETGTLIFGDGFNFLPIGPQAPAKSAIATALLTPITESYVIATPKVVTWYDTIVYNLESGFTPSLGTTVTMNEAMTFSFSSDYAVSASVPNVQITLKTYLNGGQVNERIINTAGIGERVTIVGLGAIPATIGQAMTLEATVDKSCDLTLHYNNTGLHEQT